ncbi:MAG: hypothetical protein HOV87_29450 [Catenulispora sp.]|nr:hypothetical protein [Catenulispora sp.]
MSSADEPPAGRARFRVLTGGRAAAPEPLPDQPSSEEPSARVSGPPPITDDAPTSTEGVADAPSAADFRVRCPDCGPQYVAIADVRFISTSGDGPDGGDADTDRYLFTCPACGLRVRRPAGPELARILKSSGVATLALRRGTDQAL